jgi:hypothetical protein
MKVHKENYKAYTEQAAVSSLVLGIMSTFFTGAAIDYFGPKSELTIPIIVVFKSSMSIPIIMMVSL